jgi:hypothetical protein
LAQSQLAHSGPSARARLAPQGLTLMVTRLEPRELTMMAAQPHLCSKQA